MSMSPKNLSARHLRPPLHGLLTVDAEYQFSHLLQLWVHSWRAEQNGRLLAV